MNRVTSRSRPAVHVARWCTAFERACRVRGLRRTPQRLAVYRALAEDVSHPTADAVLSRVRETMPGVPPASVYRILDSLEREGLIRRVGTTDGIARYDANLTRHQHVVCRRCGRMTDLQVPALASVRVAPRTIPGFVVEELDVRILGRCVRCASGRSRRGRGRTHVVNE
jgi:Fur family transcriptional regulator, peroxide stress response regulator